MTDLRKAMQMALDALEYPGPSWLESRQKAAEAIRAALAQPKPPIIEEWYLFHGGNGNFFVNDKFLPNVRFTFDPDTKMPIKVELI